MAPKACVYAAVAVLVLLLVALGARGAGRSLWRGQRFAAHRTRLVIAGVDGEAYNVHSAHAGQQEAANRLALTQDWAIGFIAHLRDKYVRGAAGDAYPAGRAAAARILARFNPDNLRESSPRNPEGDTAYTINKGEVFALCLRERDPARTGHPELHDFHDMTTLKFVTAHELAHLGVDVYDHPPEFWRCFKLLLAESQGCCLGGADGPAGGQWPDYGQSPVWYCGLYIDYNPLYDPGVGFP